MSDPIDQNSTDAPTTPTIIAPAETPTIVTPQKSTTQKAQETVNNAFRVGRVVVLIILVLILALFVYRNWNDVEFDFVLGDAEMPLAFLMLIFLLIGALIGMLFYWIAGRKVRQSRK